MSPGHPKMPGILPLAHPFGMNQEGAWGAPTNSTENRYQYNGKELNTDFGLNLNDYGARWYDAAIARWTSVDPLAEISKGWSAYAYVANNPILFIDPNGMKWKDPQKDAKIAARLQSQIRGRKEDEQKNLERANSTVENIKAKIAEKGSSKNLEKRLRNANATVASIKETIGHLEASSSELAQMGSDDVAQEFTFDEINGDEGSTYLKDGVITMEVVSDHNAIHEATHGFQIQTGQIIGGDKKVL
jgi:RHS repeat-associated protein